MAERENTVAVIGGLGRMGVVTRRLFEETGHPVIISDIKDRATLPTREAIREAGIVFFSVLPIENIGDIIQSTADLFGEDHRVLDNASLKDPLQRGYEVLNGRGVSICSTHPLCKDDQPLFGQNVLIAPFGQHPQEATQIAETAYGNAGMVLIRVDFDKHDGTLLVNQALPHLVNRTVGEVLADLGVDLQALDRISTANSRLFFLAVWRTLVQEAEISATILEHGLQTPEGIKIAEKLEQALFRLREAARVKGELQEGFRTTVAALDPSGKIAADMNERSIVVLELLANLSRHSITIEIDGPDRPGLLIPALVLFQDKGINMKAIASHQTETGWRFRIGFASGEIIPEITEQLVRLGYRVAG